MAANFSVDTPLGAAIAKYTGCKVVALDVRPDPVLENVFAVKATTIQELFLGYTKSMMVLHDGFYLVKARLACVTESDLEEAVFTAWPPTARG